MLVRNENAMIAKKEQQFHDGGRFSSLRASQFSPRVRNARDTDKSNERDADVNPRWTHSSSAHVGQSQLSLQQNSTPVVSELPTTTTWKEKSLYVHTSRVPQSPTKTMSMTTASPVKQVCHELFFFVVDGVQRLTPISVCFALPLCPAIVACAVARPRLSSPEFDTNERLQRQRQQQSESQLERPRPDEHSVTAPANLLSYKHRHHCTHLPKDVNSLCVICVIFVDNLIFNQRRSRAAATAHEPESRAATASSARDARDAES